MSHSEDGNIMHLLPFGISKYAANDCFSATHQGPTITVKTLTQGLSTILLLSSLLGHSTKPHFLHPVKEMYIHFSEICIKKL